jgi:hypothetical protein
LSLCSYLALHEDISFSGCIVPCNLSLTIDGEYSALSSATLSLCEESIAHWTVGVVDPKAGLDAAKKSNLDSPNSSAHSIHYSASLLAHKGSFVFVLMGEDKQSF